MSKTDEIVAVDDNVSSYMDKIIKLCNKHDSQLLLVSSPSPKNYNYGKHNGLVEFSTEKDLCYLDLNLEVANIGIDWNTDTMDGGDHLNWAGGDKLSRYLGEYILTHYSLEDYRGHDNYASWHQAQILYDEKWSEAKKIILGQ